MKVLLDESAMARSACELQAADAIVLAAFPRIRSANMRGAHEVQVIDVVSLTASSQEPLSRPFGLGLISGVSYQINGNF